MKVTYPRPKKCPVCGKKDIGPTWSRGYTESAIWRCRNTNCGHSWVPPSKEE